MEKFLGIVAGIFVFAATGLMTFSKAEDILPNTGNAGRILASVGVGIISAIIIFCFIYFA